MTEDKKVVLVEGGSVVPKKLAWWVYLCAWRMRFWRERESIRLKYERFVSRLKHLFGSLVIKQRNKTLKESGNFLPLHSSFVLSIRKLLQILGSDFITCSNPRCEVTRLPY